jgi:hypothetical protein
VTAITFSRNSALDRFMKADEVMNERRAIAPPHGCLPQCIRSLMADFVAKVAH